VDTFSTSIVSRLKETGLLDQLAKIEPRADPGEWIARVHSTAYMERVRKACEACGDRIDHLDSSDVPICAQSYRAAVAAAGALLDAVDAVMDGKIRNSSAPSAHLATTPAGRKGDGVLHPTLVAAAICAKHHVEQVLIVDWDVHHGNGTQDASIPMPRSLLSTTSALPGLGGRVEGRGARLAPPSTPLRGARRCGNGPGVCR
jgi:acetoin utilization deacetylase AcuC-like enzyme